MFDTRVKVRGVAIVALAVLASGCSSIRDHRGYLVDPALTDSVQPGVDNRLSVERALGQPTFKSQFGRQTWYYVSIDTRQKPFSRPRTKNESIFKINFDPAGNVQSVERGGMEKVAQINPDGDKTLTLGRDRSFFEDLFGNIGQVGAVPGSTQGGSGPAGSGPNGS
ncbi:outer membrane protein assembly factor BamE [Novosphingobium sp. KCTC 2891]|uniref:outer membrane protein assembly factor BamE n=1 Tax=Novosphingobium sp. KCTC 2891 TaxID=2989730 RepID=UPI0022226242|nr:outer membrane protein assembly factor BamE [Novosphingobium sp. KCTC 2891]MCW1384044.1 outer membrane protein assembly factor BamE [Novosphingobium sp. KCTC 2891]